MLYIQDKNLRYEIPTISFPGNGILITKDVNQFTTLEESCDSKESINFS
jgi:hypothetical protein